MANKRMQLTGAAFWFRMLPPLHEWNSSSES